MRNVRRLLLSRRSLALCVSSQVRPSKWSTSEVLVWKESPFAFGMDRAPWSSSSESLRDGADPLMMLLAEKGKAWEREVLESRCRGAVDLSGRSWMATVMAAEAGVPCLYQATLEYDGIFGVADFLVKSEDDDTYEIWDTKLATAPRVRDVYQVASYADLARGMGLRVSSKARLVSPRANDKVVDVEVFGASWRRLRDRFLRKNQENDDDTVPLPRGDAPLDAHGRWRGYARTLLEERDDLTFVAGMTKKRRKALIAHGIGTMAKLAEQDTTEKKKVNVMPELAFERLRAQAKLQKKASKAGRVCFEKLHGGEIPVDVLPPASAFDSYFDLEGDPFAKREYLWGVLLPEDEWLALWAHDREAESRCFATFLDGAYDRWQQGGRVYHYGHYEMTALRRVALSAEDAEEREGKLEAMARGGAFVDLYKVVKRYLQIGAESYSLKAVEKLYNADRSDSSDVADAVSSVVAYDAYAASKDATILESLEAYNKFDCESTKGLVEWLRTNFKAAPPLYEVTTTPETTEESSLEGAAAADEKSKKRQEEESYRRDVAAKVVVAEDNKVAGWLEYHRRESRPLWRQRRDWLEALPRELLEDERCVGGCSRVGEGVAPPEKSRRRRRSYDLEFPRQPVRLLEPETRVTFRNDLDFGAETTSGTVVEVVEEGRVRVLASKEPPLRCSLLPDDYVNPMAIPKSIARNLDELYSLPEKRTAFADFVRRTSSLLTSEDHPEDPESEDPESESQSSSESSPGGGRKKKKKTGLLSDPESIAAAVKAMDRTTLAIRGPPGTGKTFVGARAIAALLDCGKKVAVTAPSHDTIEHLISHVRRQQQSPGTMGDVIKIGSRRKKTQDPSSSGRKENFRRETSLDERLAKEIAKHEGPLLVGATAWAFASERSLETYDYLFVDEAGQFPAANLAATARCASNLVLLGDQAQLPAPTRGAHPDGSGGSCLEYYLGGLGDDDDKKVPDHVFLASSRRMRPEICQVVSKLFYDGNLRSHETATTRHLLPKEEGFSDDDDDAYPLAGLCVVEVESDDTGSSSSRSSSTTSNEAEARQVAEVVAMILKTRTFQGRSLTSSDVLVVAPYNAHARLVRQHLARRGCPDVKVGTVDLFQGKEAPVVVASLCASVDDFEDVEDDHRQEASSSPRSVAFVLDKRRLNVALSRAQCLAVVVASPHLADAPATTVDTMALVANYARLRELAHKVITTPKPRRDHHSKKDQHLFSPHQMHRHCGDDSSSKKDGTTEPRQQTIPQPRLGVEDYAGG